MTHISDRERETIANILRQKIGYSEEQVQQDVDYLERLAFALIEIWKRHRANDKN